MNYLTLYNEIRYYFVNMIHYNERIGTHKLDNRTIIDEGDSLDDVIKKLKENELLFIYHRFNEDEWIDIFGKSYEDEQYALVELVKSRVIESMKDWIEIQHHEAMCEYHDNKQLRSDPHGYYGVSPSDFI